MNADDAYDMGVSGVPQKLGLKFLHLNAAAAATQPDRWATAIDRALQMAIIHLAHHGHR